MASGVWRWDRIIYCNPFLINKDLSDNFDSSRALIFVLFLLLQGGEMELFKVRDKILSSIRSTNRLVYLHLVHSWNMFTAIADRLALEKCNIFINNGTYLHLYPRFPFSFILVSETIDSG